MKHPRALGWKSPWTGSDFDDVPVSYWVWFKLYRFTRRVKHYVGWHDWRWKRVYSANPYRYCDWCGVSK